MVAFDNVELMRAYEGFLFVFKSLLAEFFGFRFIFLVYFRVLFSHFLFFNMLTILTDPQKK